VIYPDGLFLKALLITMVRYLHSFHELLAVVAQPITEVWVLRGLLTLPSGRFPTRRT
jgi:hypothetical protein